MHSPCADVPAADAEGADVEFPVEQEIWSRFPLAIINGVLHGARLQKMAKNKWLTGFFHPEISCVYFTLLVEGSLVEKRPIYERDRRVKE